MPGSDMSIESVKAAIGSVECSKPTTNSSHGGAPSLSPKKSKSGASGKESKFHDGGVPGYKRGKAKKAPQF